MDRETVDYVINNCACFYFRSASRVVTQLFDRMLAPAGLRSTQLVILVLLEAKGPLSYSDLAAQLVLDQTSFSRVVRPLLRQGWVKVEPGRDRRVRILKLTAKGSHLIDKAAPYWQQAQSKIVESLGDGEFAQLRERLAKMIGLADSLFDRSKKDNEAD